MSSKRIWTQQEDDFLRHEVKSNQNKKWVAISQKLNEKFGGESRSAKQCRQRFINHASTQSQEPFSNEWNENQIKQLFEFYERYGPKWTIISHNIANKSENIVKNKFYCSLRKFVRKLNKFLKERKNKYKKQIRYESIIRVMDVHDSASQIPQNYKVWSYNIRKKILELTSLTISDGQIDDSILDWLSENINKFNLQTRSYKSKKPKHFQTEKNQETESVYSQIQNTSKKEKQNSQDELKPCQQKELAQIQRIQCQSDAQKKQLSSFKSVYSGVSQQQLYEDFGEVAKLNLESFKPEQKNIFLEMFPEDFADCQMNNFLLQ